MSALCTLLTGQFRSAEELVAMDMGRWNAAVALCFILPFVMLFGSLAAIAFVGALRLMSHVDRKAARR